MIKLYVIQQKNYDKKKEVLKNISFKVKHNQTIGFVGKSGSGKSTIFSLLAKLYDIDEGEILIDGVNINKLDRDSVRGNISIITQSPYIFNKFITIYNIKHTNKTEICRFQVINN